MARNTRKKEHAETKKLIDNDTVFQVRSRFTIAQINAGVELLPALKKAKYVLVDLIMIAIGGAVGGLTTLDVKGTQSAVVQKLVAAAQAGLTQSTVVRAGDATGAVLADGASFAPCDLNTAINVGKTGGDATTATHVDFLMSYRIEGDISPY